MATKPAGTITSFTVDTTPEVAKGTSLAASVAQQHAVEVRIQAIATAAKAAGITPVHGDSNVLKVDGGTIPEIVKVLNNPVPVLRNGQPQFNRDGSPMTRVDQEALRGQIERAEIRFEDFLVASGISAQAEAISGKPVRVQVSVPRR